MKQILLAMPYVAGLVGGGVSTQAHKTLKACQNRGLPVVAYNPWDVFNHKTTAAVHIFRADYEMHNLSQALHAQRIPQLVSPIFFTSHAPWKVKALQKITHLLSRGVRGIKSDLDYVGEQCRNAEIILPNTHDEAEILRTIYSLDSKKITVIPNGVDRHFYHAQSDLFRQRFSHDRIILSVGNLGSHRKNGLNLIRALGSIDHPSYIIGPLFDTPYGKICQQELSKYPQIHWLGALSHNDPLLASAYAAAKVFVLPSLYETPGIASMEAALAGAEVVTTPFGGTKEYFADWGIYIDPYNVRSIATGIEIALNRHEASQSNLREYIYQHFSWESIAEQYHTIYQAWL